ncbi:MAG: glycine cleavage system aminomethyltransferase GcvT [Sandaracinaceae bacterium]
MTDDALLHTPLYDEHRALGGRLVPFAGYSMPVQYEGVVAEHQAVRTRAGVFDVSHMGELWLRGPGALAVADSVTTNRMSDLPVGRAKYTCACNAGGTILDDLIVYRAGEEEVLVVCNASNLGKMSAHFATQAKGRCDFEDASGRTALIALQGPKAKEVAAAIGFSPDALALKAFGVARIALKEGDVMVARTGYTGEDGFEIFCANEAAAPVWRRLLEAGKDVGIAPAGLGARDTLRLEACLCLYGNDIDETTNPYEAGLGWVVKLDREFIGRDALAQVKEQGPSRKLVGMVMTGRGIGRHGYPIHTPGGERIGEVTSGSPGPTVGQNVALGYVPTEHAAIGTKVAIEIRGKHVDAEVVKTPFYKRS